MLGPDNAVYGLRGRVPDGAAREGLGGRRGRALVALAVSLSSRDRAKFSDSNLY